MKRTLRRWINGALRPLGVQVVAAHRDERQALVDLLHRRGIEQVIDVGANCGQFASGLLDKGFRGSILCVEPQSHAHSALNRRFENLERVRVLPRIALGAEVGEAQLYLAANSVSSSLLPMAKSHTEAAPHSGMTGTEDVPLGTIDSFFATEIEQGTGTLLKIDTQGFELPVLQGSRSSLPSIQAVLLEMSTTTLYEGQADWRTLHDFLCEAGFELWNVMPDFRDRTSGRLLQFDGLYMRP